MKTAKLFIPLATTALLLLASCTEPIEFTGEETNPIAVMQATATQDSTFQVHLTWSRFFLDDGHAFPNIGNADVQLTVNGVAQPLLNCDSGRYYFGHRPQSGDTMLITAKVPGYERGILRAQTVVPHEPQIALENCTIDSSNSSGYNKEFNVAITLRLDDPSTEENYYSIKLLYNEKTNYGNTQGYFVKGFNINDPLITGTSSAMDILIGEGSTTQDFREMLFSDQNVNGKSHNITINAKFYAYRNDDVSGNDDSTSYYWYQYPDTVMAVVKSLSAEEYRYIQSSQAAKKNDGNFFAEPVQVICNVENGIGHLGAVSLKKIIIKKFH